MMPLFKSDKDINDNNCINNHKLILKNQPMTENQFCNDIIICSRCQEYED